MSAKDNAIEVFITYSEKDEALFKKVETHLKSYEKDGTIYIRYTRRLKEDSWDKKIYKELDSVDIILMLISVDFLVNDYCYDREVEQALVLHSAGKCDLIPILLRDVDLEDTPFKGLKILPSNGKSISSSSWKDEDQPFNDIKKGFKKVLEKMRRTTKDIFISTENPPMPYCIKKLRIRNFRCLENIHIEHIPVDAQWVLLTGENADGKTSLLQALAIGLLEDSDKFAWHLLKNQSAADISIECKANNRNRFYHFSRGSKGWEKEIYAGLDNDYPVILLGYGVTRMNIQSEQIQDSRDRKESQPAYSLFNETEGNFQNIEKWLKDKYIENGHKDSEQTDDVKHTLLQLMPSIKKILFKGSDLVYLEEDGFEARYEDLSSGYKSIVAMIGDMMVKILTLYPYYERVSNFEGIVLIDELDLHLHPLLQKEIPGLLSTAFPRVQFWAATHSIVPFMGIPEQSVCLKVKRTKDKGVILEKLDIDVKNLLPNTLISSPLFDMEQIINKLADDFRSEDTYPEVLKSKELDKKLEEAAKKFKLPKSFFDPYQPEDDQ